MKYFVTITGLIFFAQLAIGQGSKKNIEFGSTVLTVNLLDRNTWSQYPFSDQPHFEYFNGLFFRYSESRIHFRAMLSYWRDQTVYGPNERSHKVTFSNKDFRVSLGAQYSVLKEKEWLYVLADIGYQKLYSVVNVGDQFSVFATTSGLDTDLGVGTKIRTLKNIYVSPELALNYFIGHSSQTSTMGVVSGPSLSESDSPATGIHPILKVHLTYNF